MNKNLITFYDKKIENIYIDIENFVYIEWANTAQGFYRLCSCLPKEIKMFQNPLRIANSFCLMKA